MKRIWILLIISGCLVFESGALAGQLMEAIQEIKRDIETGTENLNGLRAEISGERVALAQKIQALQKETASLRRKTYGLKDFLWQKETGFSQLKQEVNFLKDEVGFSSSLLSEYRRDMTKRMSMAEEEKLQAQLERIDNILVLSPANSLKAVQPLLELVANKNKENLAGSVFKGSCLDEAGSLVEGNFILAGPVTYFLSHKENLAGIAGLKLGSSRPCIIDRIKPGSLKKLLENKKALVPVDVTLGGAALVKESKKDWLEHIQAGGIVMAPILGLGLFCLIVVIWKFLSLSKLNLNIQPVLKDVLGLIHKGDISEAEKKARGLGRPAGEVFCEAVHHHNASREHLEEIIHERVLSQIPFLESYLPFLAVSAAAAPLLGLLGTVTGMIHTFNMITIFGAGKAKLLSGGISEALITTEYGLIIAIPVLLAHAYLSRRVKRIISVLEQESTAFINRLKIRHAG